MNQNRAQHVSSDNDSDISSLTFSYGAFSSSSRSWVGKLADCISPKLCTVESRGNTSPTYEQSDNAKYSDRRIASLGKSDSSAMVSTQSYSYYGDIKPSRHETRERRNNRVVEDRISAREKEPDEAFMEESIVKKSKSKKSKYNVHIWRDTKKVKKKDRDSNQNIKIEQFVKNQENLWGLVPSRNDSMKDRIEALETFIFGMKKKGSFLERLGIIENLSTTKISGVEDMKTESTAFTS